MDLLLVEDKDSFRRLLSQALAGTVWTARAVGDPQEALRALSSQPFHVLVTDLRLPGMSGLELIRRARLLQPNLRVVLMSAFGEPQDIVAAMRLGADDFLAKPFDLEAFLGLLERLRALVEAPPPDPAEPWVAHSPAMQALEAGLAKAAGVDLPVLFRGERGSGRERCARRLHVLRHGAAPYRSLSAETLGPGGPEPALLDLLAGGSLYLSRLEHLAPEAVASLCRALEQGPGTRLSWMGGVEPDGALDQAVAHRLGALELRVPPLRERREDLLVLARQWLERAARREGRPAPWLERAAERQLLEYPWPGHVRELEGLLDRTLRHLEGHVIRGFPDLGLGDTPPLTLAWPEPGLLEPMLRQVNHQAEARLLRRALQEAAGDLPRAADGLGLTVRTLAQRLRERGIPLDDGSAPAGPLKAEQEPEAPCGAEDAGKSSFRKLP